MKYLKKLIYRASNNVFGKLFGALAYGAAICLCCNALTAGLTILCFSGVSLLFCMGQLALEDHRVAQENKYFPEPEIDEYKVSEKTKEPEIEYEKEETTKVVKTEEKTK